jgi:hypothetical protein
MPASALLESTPLSIHQRPSTIHVHLKEVVAMPKKRALIVAINNYGSPVNNLPSCVADGEAFERYLQAAHGFSDIRKLFDGDATVQKVQEQLGWLTQSAAPDDTLVFCFSGHGYSKPDGAVVSEYLVLVNDRGEPELWLDDELVRASQEVPPGVLFGHIDSCFSGGMTKLLLGSGGVEMAKIKAYQPSCEELSKGFAPAATPKGLAAPRLVHHRKFGRGAPHVRAQPGAVKALGAAAPIVEDTSEASQPEFNGTLGLACSEIETAAASTAQTGGLSAFTCKVLEAASHLPTGASTRDVLAAAAAGLAAGGLRQTCSAWAPEGSKMLERGFLDPHTPAPKANGAANGNVTGTESGGTLGVERIVSALLDVLQARGDTDKSLASILPSPFSVTNCFQTNLPRQLAAKKDLVIDMATTSNVHPIDSALTERVLRSLLANHTQNGAHKDLAITAPGASSDANQKLLELIVPFALAVLNSATRKKEFSLDSADTTAADKKLFGDILRVLGDVAPVVIDAISGSTKELGAATPANDEAREKFLPLIPLIPVGISLLGTLISSIPKKKDIALDDAASGGAAADKALLDLVGAIVRIAQPVVRGIAAAAQAA